MAGGVMLPDGGTEFPGKLTWNVVLCTVIAAFGGLMFGYDIGISGPFFIQSNYIRPAFLRGLVSCWFRPCMKL